MMFSGIVAIICPIGLTRGRREILSKGLVSHGAVLLGVPRLSDSKVGKPSPSDLLPDDCRLLTKNAAERSSSKRKRAGGGAAGRSGGNKGSSGDGSGGAVSRKAEEEGPTPTHILCEAEAFRAGRVSLTLQGILSCYPLTDNASSVKVVGFDWLSECLRLDALQPLGSHLLKTVTRSGSPGGDKKVSSSPKPMASSDAHLGKEEKKQDTKASSEEKEKPSSKKGKKEKGKETKEKAPVFSSSSGIKKNPWTASVARPSDMATKTSSGPSGVKGTTTSPGVGAGPGGARGPGGVSKEAVWRDEVRGTGNGGEVAAAEVNRGQGGRWEELMKGSVMRWVPDTRRVSTHILAFDMDGTLIKTKSGKRFGDGEGDWELMYANTSSALKAWYQRGYKVAIVSNQLGVGKGKVDKRSLQTKVEGIVKALKVPVEAYMACEDDYYRKPRPGCWELLSSIDNGGLDVLTEACLYVGDAAGRPKDGPRKKDFSAGDLKLAINVGVPFQTPEQFFSGSTQRLHRDRSLALLGFDPLSLCGGEDGKGSANLSPTPLQKASSILGNLSSSVGSEVVVLVGPPAAGKSSLCTDILAGHVRVNQDELSSLARCRKMAKSHLEKGNKVVIDATNTSRKTRLGWISLASEHGVPARCVFLETPKEACFHLNAFRGCNPWSPEGKRRTVPDVVIHSWFKNVEPVDSSEGFSEIVRIPFVLREFDESRRKERDLLLMHLLPK